MGNAGYSSDVQLVVSYFGPTDCVTDSIMARYIVGEDYTMEDAMMVSPYYQITKDAPPLYLTHGANDQSVKFMHSEKMAERAKGLLGEENVTTVFYEDAPHANIKVYDSDSAILSVEEFISTHLTQFREELGAAPSETEPVENTPAESVQPATPETEDADGSGSNPTAVIVVVVVIVIVSGIIAAAIIFRKKQKH